MGNAAATPVQEDFQGPLKTPSSSFGVDGDETVETASNTSVDKFDLLESLADFDVQIARVRSKLEEIRSLRSIEISQFKVDIAEYERVMQLNENKFWTIMESSKPKLSTPPQTYIEIVKKARREEDNIQSSYIMSLEAQLCRASQVLGAYLFQSTLAAKRCEEFLGFLKTTIVRETEDATVMEMNVLNDIYALDTENKSIKDDYLRAMEEQRVETTKLSLQIATKAEKSKCASVQEDARDPPPKQETIEVITVTESDSDDDSSSTQHLDLFLDRVLSPRSVTDVTTTLELKPSKPLEIPEDYSPPLEGGHIVHSGHLC